MVVVGDVEIHLRAIDWTAHGHAADPAYNNVVLHVTLFPSAERVTMGATGRPIPVLALLPLLNHDLEEYAADEAIERLADHPLAQARRELISMSAEKLAAELVQSAQVRWRQKVHYAKLRIAMLGWDAACHHTALEILGYRFNRAPMLAAAGLWPLAEWGRAGEEIAETAFTRFADRWSKQGVRPANHPRARLRQYAHWLGARPDWPRQLVNFAAGLPSIALSEAVQTANIRRRHQWTALARRFSETIFGDEVGGTRFNTLVCDGLLPLIAAQVGGENRLSGVWYAWPIGDIPSKYARLLRELGAVDKRHRPMSHGVVQGLIGWLLVADQRHEEVIQPRRGAGLDNASDQKLF
jgi:hypothetical protein